ncbi:MAG: KpsF/GutQ family sugar-phosphate isomerase [Verrucomicrobiota bacterium]|nr:KpsF/GutQ family sugar-phosphate isomerase [Verrucomicrobiota bacterium]
MIDSKAILACAKKVFEVEIGGLEKTRDSLGDAFVATVRLMVDTLEADGLVVVTGVGKSLHVAEKMSAVFASTGTRSIVLNPVQAMHGDLGMTSPRDMLIALSFSGESEEVVKLVPAIRRHGLKVVAVTGNPDSTLARASDLTLPIPCGAEACPFGMAPTNSATATMAMGDALAMAMVEARKFTVEEYAGNHPAGAIGRALTLKASDVMRRGDDFAKVPPSATVLQSLMAMTRAKTGSAVVADCDGRLAGIFTDGDFRRMVAERSSVDVASTLSAEVSKVMTKSPMSIRDTAYAAEIVKVFERRRIDDLPVVDEAGRVVGLVDIQDLPKMKVI